MAKKKGYGSFTPARRMALRRAALISARKRRKHGSQSKASKTKQKEGLSNKKKAAIVAGAAVAVGLGAGLAAGHYQNKKDGQFFNDEIQKLIDADKAMTPEQRAAEDAKYEEERANMEKLVKLAGDGAEEATSKEQYEARVKLFGKAGVIQETSDVHLGRAEIFPTRTLQEVSMMYAQEAQFPSFSIRNLKEDADGYVTLYHRTGGGKDLDGQKAKESLLKDQQFKILNRDEKRVAAINPAAKPYVKNTLVWMSNVLNESNTRAAFGETVVKVKVRKNTLLLAGPDKAGSQSFGNMSPGEIWLAIDPEVLKGAIIEDVPPEEIKPPPKRKYVIGS